MKTQEQKTQNLTKGIIAAVILFMIILLVSPFVVVNPGKRGMVLDFGTVQKIVSVKGFI